MSDSDLEDYRERARGWIVANLAPRSDGSAARAPSTDPPDDLSARIGAQRVLQRRIFDAGYAGISWPGEYGGQGLSAQHERVFTEEARSFVLPDFGIVGGATFAVCAPTMLAHASPEFLRLHIPRILAGDELVSQFFSEPEAGSDLAGVRTKATRDSGHWLLSGSKIWSSGAYYADVGLCLARTNWDVPKHQGLTWFAVPVDAPGVTVRRIKQITGDADFCQEFFDDVVLTDADIVGEVDGGWVVAQTMLRFERGGGIGQAGSPKQSGGAIAPDLVRLARSVGALGEPLTDTLIVRAHVDDLARRALLQRLGGLMRSDPRRAASFASYAKLASGVFDPIRANLAMRIGGVNAVSWDDSPSPESVAARGFLNSRFMSIAGGTNEAQRNSIGERVLGLAKEPSFDIDKPFRDVLRDSQNWSGRIG